MKSMAWAVIGAAAIVLSPAVAVAGPFGGFTADGSYLFRGDRRCRPVSGPTTAPACEKLEPAEVSRLALERPAPERGSSARFVARASGTVIELRRAGETEAIARWDSGSPVGRVAATYANKAGTAVAVEFETRFGGRMAVDVVGFAVTASSSEDESAIAGTAGAATRPESGSESEGDSASNPTLGDVDQKAHDAAISRARRALGGKRYRKAAAAVAVALGIWDQSAEALYLGAAIAAARKKTDDAIAALERLATSTDPTAPEYRVEARTDKHFATLLADSRFRRAVGIVVDPKRPLSAYERLMGLGGVWEQRLIACDQPEVKLQLRRKKRRFLLRIRSRCQGPLEATFLDGTWKGVAANRLELSFPNPGAANEIVTCRIERCRDSSGEDCVRCRIDQDLEFLLRVVRRK